MLSYKIKYNYKDEFRRTTLPTMELQTVRKAARGLFTIPGTHKIHLTWVDEDGDAVHVSTDAEFQEFLQYSATTAATIANPDLFSYKFGVITQRIKEDATGEGDAKNPKKLERQRLKAEEKARKHSKSPKRGRSNSPRRSRSMSAECRTDVKNTTAAASSSSPKALPDGINAATACHAKIRCNACGVSPIIGIRYKCTGRVDYDLCASCEASSDHPFPMLKMVEPNVGNCLRLKGKEFGPNINKNRAPGAIPCSPEPLTGPAVHDGITCTECGVVPITGTRYKCTGRDAYDICETCEGTKGHPFPTIKIYRSDPTVHVKGWGTSGKTCPANPFGFKGFPAPAGVKEGTKGKAPNGKKRASSESPEWRRQALKPIARFMSDVSIPDATIFEPSTEFVKTWLVRNDGPGDWPSSGAGVRLVSVGGDRLCPAGLSLPVESLKADTETHISVPLVAPSTPGRYVAYFRLKTADGIAFGQKLWVDICVQTAGSDIVVKDAEPTAAESAIANEAIIEIDFAEEDFDFVNVPILPEEDVTAEPDGEAVAMPGEEAQTAIVEEDDDEKNEWKVELDTLSAMGFHDTRLNVKLLKEHAKFSFAQHPQLHGKPFSDSFSTILDALVK